MEAKNFLHLSDYLNTSTGDDAIQTNQLFENYHKHLFLECSQAEDNKEKHTVLNLQTFVAVLLILVINVGKIRRVVCKFQDALSQTWWTFEWLLPTTSDHKLRQVQARDLHTLLLKYKHFQASYKIVATTDRLWQRQHNSCKDHCIYNSYHSKQKPFRHYWGPSAS